MITAENTALSLDRFWDGNRACAEGALMAGLRFYGGYPITPSTEIAEFLSWRLPQEGGVFMQVEDEIAGLATCIGASQGGMKAMTATSGPGFSLMQENIGFACMAEIPVVIVNVQRMGPSTGQPTRPAQGDLMQAIWGTHGDHPIIVISPSSVQEMMAIMVRAFNLSERFRTPVIVLTDEVIAHMRERVTLLDPASLELWERPTPEKDLPYLPYADTPSGVPPMAAFGDGHRYHVTGLFHDEHGFPVVSEAAMDAWTRRVFRKIEDHLDVVCAWEVRVGDQVFGAHQIDHALSAIAACEALIVSYGASARSAVAAAAGRPFATLRLQTVWPLDDKRLGNLLAASRQTLVVEMNRGQMLREIQRIAGGRSPVRGVLRWDGELVRPADIVAEARHG